MWLRRFEKFDLRYGEGVKKLFLGNKRCRSTLDNEFSLICYFSDSVLSDGELAQIGIQAPVLAELVSNAPVELRALLRLPFNIRLIADLLADGVSSAELTPVRTQLELLDRYRLHRVIGERRQRRRTREPTSSSLRKDGRDEEPAA